MDRLIRAISKDSNIRCLAIDSRDMVEEARIIHDASPVATAALGRALSAVSMMGVNLKSEEGSVTLQIKGDGELGSVITVSDSKGYTRGYLQSPAADLPLRADGKLNVGAAVGKNGLLGVIIDNGQGEPYIGQVPLVSGEIAEDVAAYFVQSEQVPTVCALGVLIGRDRSVLRAGGYILQLMPSADPSVVDTLEQNVRSLPDMTGMLNEGLSLEDILKKVTGDSELDFIGEQNVAYCCGCSQAKVEGVLVSLGKRELDSMINEGLSINVNCQFCNKDYVFSIDQLGELSVKAVSAEQA